VERNQEEVKQEIEKEALKKFEKIKEDQQQRLLQITEQINDLQQQAQLLEQNAEEVQGIINVR
jgi:hypothetical protein